MEWGPLLGTAFDGWMALVVAYMLVTGAVYFGLAVVGYFALRCHHGRLRRGERDALFGSALVPRVSVVTPALDEIETIVQSVKGLLTLRYPHHEVIVVNDGSTDGTLGALIEEFRLYRSSRIAVGEIPTRTVRAVYESRDPIPLVVVDKEGGGKADALNAGLNMARGSIVATVDADTILEPDALLHVMRPFLEEGGEGTIAAGGTVRVANGCRIEHGRVVEIGAPRSILAAFQAVEYLRAFLGGRIAYSFLNSLLVISGAFAVFRRGTVVEAGGFRTRTVGEDMELVVRLHRRARDARADGEAGAYRIVFVPEPVSWTEVPESLGSLNRQRNRWQRGLVESLWTHRSMALHPRYGVVGMVAFPYFIALEGFGPTIEMLGYVVLAAGLGLGLLEPWLAALFLVVSLGLGTLLSLGSLLLEELTVRRYPNPRDLVRLVVAAVVESFGLRQLLGVWRTKALLDAVRRRRDWGPMDRRGFDSPLEDRA